MLGGPLFALWKFYFVGHFFVVVWSKMNDQFVDAAVVASFWESGFKYRNEKATILKKNIFELFREDHPGISKEFFHRTSKSQKVKKFSYFQP